MGYACPVCDTPQRDGEHLAHHLAFTAMLHGDAHEDWLDEHVPDWGDREPAGLAAEVTPHAADAEYDEVFEDTVARSRPDVGMGSQTDAAPTPAHDHDDGRGHAHDHGGGRDASPGAGIPDPDEVDDPTVAEAIREARELTSGTADGDAEIDPEPDGDPDDEAAADRDP
jgi:hypothetical protein